MDAQSDNGSSNLHTCKQTVSHFSGNQLKLLIRPTSMKSHEHNSQRLCVATDWKLRWKWLLCGAQMMLLQFS